MMTKKIKVGGGNYGVYKTVIDWDTVGAWAITIGIVLMLLKACG